MALSGIERGVFIKLFNRGGYVLDFSTSDFDTFTLESVGVALCEKYHLSKGRSLNAYINEADENLADKLLFDLLEYYELSYDNFERETVPNEFGKVALDYGVDYSVTYKKCKEIQKRHSSPLSDYTNSLASNIKDAFSSDYIYWQMQIMMSMQSENPTEAIGKAKEIIESCCKGILEENGLTYDRTWDAPRLVKETTNLLKIAPDNIPSDIRGAESMISILKSLRAIANGLNELRNVYGSGHGKSPNYQGLSERHARLAVGSALTLVNFLWDSHLRMQLKKFESATE